MFVESILPHLADDAARQGAARVGPWLEGRSAAALFRTNPRHVAAALDLSVDATVDVFLAGVLEGWFDLRWDFHCPHCQGIPHFAHGLADSRATDFCGACNVEFRNQLDTNVEVTFSPAPRLVAFDPEQENELLTQYHSDLMAGRGPDPAQRYTGLELLHRPLFQERYGHEVLSVEESLEIRRVVFLFTDIKGSTQLYETLGDSQAYQLVREHFKVLFSAVAAEGGVVVKTIGDAVMASFRGPAAALEAALRVHDTIAALKVPGTDRPVVVKMGLHAGPAIAVTMNDRFDYFGQTVNRAARIQGLAKDQEIYFSEVVFQDPGVRRRLAGRKAAVRRWKAQLRGIEGEQTVYSVS